MMRLPVAEPLALVRGIVIHRLARIVGDIGDPVGQPRQPLGYARAAVEVPAAGLRLVVGPLRLRSEEHTSELQSHSDLVCRLLLEKKKKKTLPHSVTTQHNKKQHTQ